MLKKTAREIPGDFISPWPLPEVELSIATGRTPNRFLQAVHDEAEDGEKKEER